MCIWYDMYANWHLLLHWANLILKIHSPSSLSIQSLRDTSVKTISFWKALASTEQVSVDRLCPLRSSLEPWEALRSCSWATTLSCGSTPPSLHRRTYVCLKSSILGHQRCLFIWDVQSCLHFYLPTIDLWKNYGLINQQKHSILMTPSDIRSTNFKHVRVVAFKMWECFGFVFDDHPYFPQI